MRTSRGCSFRVRSSQGVSHCHLRLAETQRQAEEWESFIVDEREKSSGGPDGRLLAWGSWRRAGQPAAGRPMGLVRMHIWLSLVGPEWDVGTKI